MTRFSPSRFRGTSLVLEQDSQPLARCAELAQREAWLDGITCLWTLGPLMACDPSGKPWVLLPMLSISKQSWVGQASLG